nr:transposase (putative), gypsy type [Tanacetum cinerariifolium]GEZ40569.1 transposase (putative), gypsy type [Tanacetum cinerariifolium]
MTTSFVDAFDFPFFVPWHNNKILKKEPHPTPTEFKAEVCEFLGTHPAPFRKFLESFLCLVGISRYYELDDNVYPLFLADDDKEMDLFAYIRHANPTKVRIGEKQIKEGHVSLLEFTGGRVVPHVVNEQGNQNNDVEDVGNQNDDVKDAGNNRMRFRLLLLIIQMERERKVYALPPKRLREDYGTSGDAGASTAEKSLAVLQDLLRSDHTDSIIGLNLQTHHPTERSSVPPPLVMTAVVATTTIIGVTSTLIHELGTGLTYIPKWNVINDSALDDPKEKDTKIENFKARLSLKDAKAAKAIRLCSQPSLEQLMLPIHRPEDQVVIRETSLSFSLDVVHAPVQRIQGDATCQRLSITDAMIPLIEPLSVENLIGEASTFKVPATATNTALSTTFIQTSSVPPISVADYRVLGARPSIAVPPKDYA